MVVMLCVLFSGAPLLHAQEQEPEKEKKEKKAKKSDEPKKPIVITNDDLDTARKKKTKAVTPKKKKLTPAQQAAIDKALKAQKAKAKKKPDPKKTEKYWRGLKYSLEDRIRKSKAKLKELETRLLKVRGAYLGAGDTSVMLRYQEELKNLSDQVANYKRGLAELERQLAELPDKARRYGVPPGWVR
jgi:outer membrane biosynthesis protein TonB